MRPTDYTAQQSRSGDLPRRPEGRDHLKQARTYPLDVALDLSPAWGATLETESVWVRVVPKLDWRVSVGIGENLTHVICQTREACRDYLQLQAYPLDDGWLPALAAQPTQTGSQEDILTSASTAHCSA